MIGWREALYGVVVAMLSQPAYAAVKVVIPQEFARVAAGATATIPIYLLNVGDAAETFAMPEVLKLRIETGGVSSLVSAVRVGDADFIELAPGNFGKTAYRLAAPSGTADVVVIAVETAPPATEPTTSVAAIEPVNADTVRRNGIEKLKNLSAYRPMYALYGAEPSNAKLQLSFKYQFFDEGGAGERGRWLSGLHFGFTQTLFWDLSQKSIPFRDIVFSPELMYLLQTRRTPSPDRPAFGLQFGVRHESNGKAGLDSRSLNTVYAEPAIVFMLGNEWQLKAAPRVWAYWGGQDGNEAIERFRGYSSLSVVLGQDDGPRVSGDFRGFVGTGRGSSEFNVSYPLNHHIIDSLNLYLHAQLFTGYGESLLDFDQRKTALRAGFSIVR